MATTLNKTYQYKVYKPDSTYLGLLPEPSSDFNYNQNLYSIGAQLQITIALTADVTSQPSSVLTDETLSPITDETGDPVRDEGVIDIVGSANSNNQIHNNNLIKIYEISTFNPNGKIVFDGYISKFKIDHLANTIILTCLNKGQDFAQTIIPGGSTYTLDQQQNTQDDFYGGASGWANSYVGQQVIVGAGTNIAAITVKLALTGGNVTTSLSLYNNATDAYNGVNLLGTATQLITSGSPTDYQFIFSSAIPVNIGQQYFFTVYVNNALQVSDKDSTNPYSGGGIFFYTPGGAFHDATGLGDDLYFKTYYTSTNTERLYTNRDVSYILNDIMTVYGGSVSYTPISNTGIVIPTYTFKANTYYEGMQAIQQMGPSNYYWYIDVATNTLKYQAANKVADLTFIQGRHFNGLDIEATKEGIINQVYYTGGDDGTGTNTSAFVKVLNSAGSNRLGTVRLTNTNVTGTTAKNTLTILADNYINQHNAETYISNAIIEDQAFDLSTIALGKMAGFAGSNNFVNNLLLQIVGMSITSDQVTIQLGTLPVRASQVVDQINSQLTSTQTIDNPDIPN